MDNASLIFDSLSCYDSITAFIGKQEDIFLDFKESRTSSGALLDDDQAHFSKAASGFAHQQGGMLVWGIEARKDADGIDEATALKPDHIKPAAEKAGVGRIGWQTFRHSFSTLLHSMGTDLAVQKELLRHADIKTTMNIYTQAVATAKRKAIRKLTKKLLKA